MYFLDADVIRGAATCLPLLVVPLWSLRRRGYYGPRAWGCAWAHLDMLRATWRGLCTGGRGPAPNPFREQYRALQAPPEPSPSPISALAVWKVASAGMGAPQAVLQVRGRV